jgi:Leucine Rich Repeat
MLRRTVLQKGLRISVLILLNISRGGIVSAGINTGLGLTFSCKSVSEIPDAECQAPVSLYDTTNGPGWTDQAGWLASNTPCTWYGATCETEHVQTIALRANQLRKAIPPELGNLASLELLYLNDNPLGGALPRSLMYLNLQEFYYDNSSPCEPPDAAFRAWLAGISDLKRTGVKCSSAYLPFCSH